MKLYVIRHGRTESNDKCLFNGRLDEDLNETGIMQAKKASEEIKKLDIDLIICSPLLRTRHTAEIINVNNVPVIYNDSIIERDFGELTEKPVAMVDRAKIWEYGGNLEYQGIEQVTEIFERVNKFLDEIKEKYKDKNILLVTHGGVSKAINVYFYGIPESGNILEYKDQDNCEIREFEL